jgi:hypothetical protein
VPPCASAAGRSGGPSPLDCQGPLSHLRWPAHHSAARRLTLGHRALVRSHSPARSRQVAQRRIHATLGYERERRATVYRREEGLPHGPGKSRQLAPRRSARRDSVLAVHICPRAAPAGDWHPEPGLFEPSSPLASVASPPGPTFEGGPGVVLTAAPRCRPWLCARRFSLFARGVSRQCVTPLHHRRSRRATAPAASLGEATAGP